MSKQLRIWLFVLLGTLLTSTSLLAQGVITMTTYRAVGETIKLKIEASGNVTIEGAQETGQVDSLGRKSYTIKSQTITIRGDVTTLDCSDNWLASLDLSGCTSLTTFDCRLNPLTSLDVSKNTDLTTLDCRLNPLTSLDVSKNTDLTTLNCRLNSLTSLDVSKNTALTELNCSSNQLTSLDVSQNTALTKLDCGYNQLTSLDVSQNTALTELDCPRNQLTSLDVSQNTALTELSCYDNQLTRLDVSQNTALTSLGCGGNQLTSLDVSKNTALTALNCLGNQINGEGMTKLVNSLPDRNGMSSGAFRVVDYSSKKKDQNWCSFADVATASKKNWKALTYINEESGWVSYLGIGEGVITMTTSKAIGETILLEVKANGDFFINGAQDTGETNYLGRKYYRIKSQTIIIQGDVTELDCPRNQLTSLDVSGSTALKYLSCEKNQLTSLNVSGCTALTYLKCYANQIRGKAMTQLEVDLPTVTSEHGGSFYVVWNLAREGNVCTATDVTMARAKSWKVIKTIERGGKDDPVYIDYEGEDETQEVGQGFIGMTTTKAIGETLELTIKANGRVTIEGVKPFLRPDGYIAHYTLTSQKIIIRGDVTEFKCWGQQLTNLDIIGCDSLTTLDCRGNQLTSLNVSGCTALAYVYCFLNRLKREVLTELVNNLPDRRGQERGELYILYDGGREGNGSLLRPDAFAAINKNWALGKGSGQNWQYYTGADVNTIAMTTTQDQFRKGFISLAIVADGDVSIDGVYEDRIATDGSEKKYTLSGNQITIRGRVTKLHCSNNQLTSLNLFCSSILEELECAGNLLTKLDLSGCESLKRLSYTDGQLNSLNLSDCVSLTELDCSKNELTSLDLSDCTSLTSLACSKNKLESLNLSACTRLKSLECYRNKIRGKAVAQLVESLPDRHGKEPGKFYLVYYSNDEYEENFCYRPAVGRANDKNWRPQKGHNNGSEDRWEDYFGVKDEGVVMMRTAQEVGSQITLTLEANGDMAIDGVKGVPVTDGKPHQYTLISQNVTIRGHVTKLHCSGNKLTSLDLSTTVPLVELDCSNNRLTALDVSHNAAVTTLTCYRNQIKGDAMAQLIKGLPQLPLRSTHLFGIVSNAADERNIFLKADVERVREKGWSPMKWDEKRLQYEPYAGKETETFAVTLTKEGKGTISATGADDLTAVPYGTELTIVATPATGYKLTALTANGEDILATKKVVIKGATEVKATFADHTGVETTVTQQVQVQLYPNPATDYVIVEGVAPASEVTLHSLTGERLYAGRVDSRGVLQIDLTPYADGVYLVCVAGETHRVVVRR